MGGVVGCLLIAELRALRRELTFFMAGDRDSPEEAKSVLVEIRNAMVEQQRQAGRLLSVMLYLRSYVWEALDRRTLAEIRNPPETGAWGAIRGDVMRDDYTGGLWLREYDYDQGWAEATKPARTQTPNGGAP